MASVHRCTLPPQALTADYLANGDYVDCYSTVVRGRIAHAQFVETFYTTLLFKLERLVLFILLFKPSTDGEIRKLARGELSGFAVWTVESRTENQLLVCDFLSRTRSWLMVEFEDWEGDLVTRLYFGTVIVRRADKNTGRRKLTLFFKVLLPFHMVYSRALLATARWRIKRESIANR